MCQGVGLDYSAFVIVEYHRSYKLVAKFRSKEISRVHINYHIQCSKTLQ